MGVWQHISKGDHLFRRADDMIQSSRPGQNVSVPKALNSRQLVKADYAKHKRDVCQWRAVGRTR